jgi:hypothetical protein
MADAAVKGYDRRGNPIEVAAADVPALERAGGRVATPEDLAKERLEASYAKVPAAGKALGFATGTVLPPTLEAYREGAASGLSAGLLQGATYQALKQVDTKAAAAYQQHQQDLESAHPTAKGVGEVGGFVAGAAIGGAGGGAALPSSRIARLGAGAEKLVERKLAGVAARGAVGRAVTTATAMGAQGAVEGALIGAGQRLGEDMLGDHEVTAEKLFAASGAGALYGGVTGMSLGGVGSLARSGARAAAGGLARAVRSGAEAAGRSLRDVSVESGVRAAAPDAIVGQVRPGPVKLSIDPDAGLRTAQATERMQPIVIGKRMLPHVSADFAETGPIGSALKKDKPPIQIQREPLSFVRDRARLDPGMVEGADIAPGPIRLTARGAEINPRMVEGAEIGPAPVRYVPERGLSAQQIGDVRRALGEAKSTGLYAHADDLAWKALGTTRKISDRVAERVEGGTRAVGNYVNRRILAKAGDEGWIEGAWAAGRAGTPGEMLPRIQADIAAMNRELGDLVRAYDVPVPLKTVTDKGGKIARELAKSSATVDGAKALQDRIGKLLEVFQAQGIVASDGTVPLSALYYERAALERAAYAMGQRGDTVGKEAVKRWLREIDTETVSRLDEAAHKAGAAGVGEKMLALKRDLHLAHKAAAAAEDGVKRIEGNNTFGIRESIGALVGLGTGHPVAGVGAAIGGKLMRERGAAAGAYLLQRAADTGAIARIVRSVDEQIGRAAKGVLLPPARGAMPRRTPVATQAARVIAMVRAAQRDPEVVADRHRQQTEALSRVAPNVAAQHAAAQSRALGYLADQIPPDPAPDPFRAPRQPTLTPMQAARIAQLGRYVERPLAFFEDVERGRVTPEGIEMAKILMPRAFEDLQLRTVEAIRDAAAAGRPIRYEERVRVSLLLGVIGDPSLHPDAIASLQGHLAQSDVQLPSGSPARSGPIAKPSTLDRLEER